ncbi:MAG: hypothetical protein LJE68_15135 [Rhodobacter sp.]|nr:hypothetical protein [Rhodobacter sp.]
MKETGNRLRGLRRRYISDKLKRPRTWLNIVLIIGVTALILVATLRIPASVTHQQARILAAGVAETDFGTRPIYRARLAEDRELYGITSEQNTPKPVHKPGDLVCLRIQEDRFTGRITARITKPTYCTG